METEGPDREALESAVEDDVGARGVAERLGTMEE